MNSWILKWETKDVFLKIALKMGGNWLSSGYRHEDIFFKGKGKKKKKTWNNSLLKTEKRLPLTEIFQLLQSMNYSDYLNIIIQSYSLFNTVFSSRLVEDILRFQSFQFWFLYLSVVGSQHEFRIEFISIYWAHTQKICTYD